MVCEKCGSILVFDKTNHWVCPKCLGVAFLSKDDALAVITKQVEWLEKNFKDYLSKFDKKRLLVWLCGEREKSSSQFYSGKPLIDLDAFLANTLLIKMVIEAYTLPGKEIADATNTPELIKLFGSHLNILSRKYRIEDDFGYLASEHPYSLSNIDRDMLMSNFSFYENEEYLAVVESFNTHLIMTKDKADKFLAENQKKYLDIIKESKPEKWTPQQTIHELFPTLIAFNGALTRNKSYADTFNLEYLKKAGISPEHISALIIKFEQKTGLLTVTDMNDFLRVSRELFGRDFGRKVNILITSPSKTSGIPLFIKLDEQVYISHNFTRLLNIFYYSQFYVSLFNDETDKLAKQFENGVVPNKLKELGFKILVGVTDKKKTSLEIDQIAWRGDMLYVIETKIWDLKPFFEHRNRQDQRDRDLKGIVDGIKYTNGVGTERPSLLKKIEYVKDNLELVCEDYNAIKHVYGLVIIKSTPIRKEYKGIKFLSFSDLDTRTL